MVLDNPGFAKDIPTEYTLNFTANKTIMNVFSEAPGGIAY